MFLVEVLQSVMPKHTPKLNDTAHFTLILVDRTCPVLIESIISSAQDLDPALTYITDKDHQGMEK